MTHTTNRLHIAVAITLALLACSARAQQPAQPAARTQAQPIDLFIPAEAPAGVQPHGTAVVEYRAVTIRLDDLANVDAGDVLTLDLLPGLTYTGVVDHVDRRSPTQYTVAGKIAENEAGWFIIAVEFEAAAGIIQVPSDNMLIKIDYLANGVQWIARHDQNLFGRCGNEPIQVPGQPAAPVAKVIQAPVNHHAADEPATDPEEDFAEGDPRGSCNSPQPIFDILVVYTTQSRDAAGGTNAVNAQVQLAIDTANQGYANSSINARARWVYRGAVTYNESGTYPEHVDRLTDPDDNVLDGVHTLRSTYHADFVNLWLVDNDGGTLCGRANCDIDESQAFSIMDWTCISNFSFHHEIGHCMGCAHNRADAGDGCNEDDYSYGWRFSGTDGVLYRTIMAYDNANGDYTRVNYFSNPNVTFMGTATGVAAGEDNAAYNAATIRNRRSDFEGHRRSGFDVWVDFAFSFPVQSGSFSFPFDTIAEGHSAILVTADAEDIPVLNVKAGSTSERPTLTKPLILKPCGGTVRIGG